MVSNEIILLKIIEKNGKISMLRDRGLSHSQIAMLISEQQAEGNIVISDTAITLTSKGLDYLQNNISKTSNKRKDCWILPQDHLYTEPVPYNKIFLPKNKNI